MEESFASLSGNSSDIQGDIFWPPAERECTSWSSQFLTEHLALVVAVVTSGSIN